MFSERQPSGGLSDFNLLNQPTYLNKNVNNVPAMYKVISGPMPEVPLQA